MAKVKNNSRIRMIGLIVAVAVLFASIVGTFVTYGSDIEDNKEEIKTCKDEATAEIKDLELEGCKPAGKNTLDIALFEKDISALQEDVSDMRTEQTAGFKEILKRLPPIE